MSCAQLLRPACAQFVSGSTSASAAGAGSAAASSAAVDSATAIAAATEAVKKAKASILTISSTKFALDDVALVLHSALAFPLAFPKEAAASESKSGSSSGAGAAGSSESKETKKQSTGSRRPRLLEADMTCPACCDFLFRPVTVSCGHSYCEVYDASHCCRGLTSCVLCGLLSPASCASRSRSRRSQCACGRIVSRSSLRSAFWSCSLSALSRAQLILL